MNYRPDIDGLRAIAIVLVLAYHGGLSILPSGFTGVDIFFVISGFLITSIIHEELNKKTFSFIDFYNRRLWRLQPVFICLLLVTTALALVFFLPDDLVQYSKSARKTSLFISNLFFDKTTTGYFSPDTQTLPLLHTWSLSIEWQCYLLLPCVIYGLHLLVPKRYVLATGCGLTLIALWCSLHNANTLPWHTYYLFSSRLFEFLLGSCIALIPKKTVSVNKKVITALGGIALIILLYGATLNPVLASYPDLHALLVCLATGVLILSGSFFPSHFLTQILGSKPLVFIGLLSYSLYIWHWIIFSFLRYQGINETPFVLTAAFGFTFILAYCSRRFIEIPSKRWKQTPFPYTLSLLLLAPILLIHLASHLIKMNNGFPQRFTDELTAVYHQLDRFSSPQRPKCISDASLEVDMKCIVGSGQKNARKALMIGDSFSNHYWGFMDVLGHSANVSILMQGVSSCITLPGIYLFDWWHFTNRIYSQCHEQTKRYYQLIQSQHYDYVIIAQLWSNYLSDKVINNHDDKRSTLLTQHRLEKALDEALHLIIDSGAIPVLVKANATMQPHFRDCFFKHIKSRRPYNPDECDFKWTVSAQELWFNTLFERMKIKYPQLIIIDPKKVQCMKGICKADINGVPVYRDVGHITDYASYQLGELYLKKYKNPL